MHVFETWWILIYWKVEVYYAWRLLLFKTQQLVSLVYPCTSHLWWNLNWCWEKHMFTASESVKGQFLWAFRAHNQLDFIPSHILEARNHLFVWSLSLFQVLPWRLLLPCSPPLPPCSISMMCNTQGLKWLSWMCCLAWVCCGFFHNSELFFFSTVLIVTWNGNQVLKDFNGIFKVLSEGSK